ncbi:MAG: hypothetical protein IH836_06355 [Proteobacteria bacterium]|nr:hypothetical protein [Pseudomonadota bacterium]
MASQTWPGFNHAAVNLPDDRKGEKIILITDNKDALRKHFQVQIKKDKHGELYLPSKVLLAAELPVLGTGKTDYLTLTQMAQKAEDEGNSWIKKLTTFVKKVGKQDKGEQEEEKALTGTDTTLLPPETLEDDDDVTIRREPGHEKSNDEQ